MSILKIMLRKLLIFTIIPLLLIVPGIAFGVNPVDCVENSVYVDYGKRVLVYGLIESDSDPIFIDESQKDGKLTFPKGNYNFILIKAITGGVLKQWKLDCTEINYNPDDIKNFEMIEKMIMDSKLGKLQIITPEYITITNNSFEIKGQLKSSMKEYPPVKIQLMRELPIEKYLAYMDEQVHILTAKYKIGCVYSDEFTIQKDGTFYISDDQVNKGDFLCKEYNKLAWDEAGSEKISDIGGDNIASVYFYLILHNIENYAEFTQYVNHSKFPPTNVLFMNSESFPLKISKVPDWVKNNAKWWADGQVDDSTFSQGIGFLIKEKVISVSSLPPQASTVAEEKIPDWIKNNAKWWADGMISEDDFLKGITYMVEKGIIRAQ